MSGYGYRGTQHSPPDYPPDCAPLPPHPRIGAPGTCGATKTGASGIEWVCIAAVHATLTDIQQNRPRIDRHYYVRRYPWRRTSSLDEQENPR